MTSKTASLITSTGATVFYGGQLYSVSPDHANYNAVCEAIRGDQLDLVPDLCDLRTAVRKWMRTAFSGDFKMVGDMLRYKDYTFGLNVTEKALSMIDAGNNAKPLLNFLAKVCLNPSNVAREELLLFCDANGFMITSDGNIVAYKAVREDYLDIYSGTKRYMVGDVVSMDRGAVDDRREQTCSRGLHFAAHSYAQMFGSGRDGSHMMAVEVDPADVVSIPNDYANQKGRAWKITVIAELEQELPKREVYDYAGGEWGDNSPLTDEDCTCDDEWYDEDDDYDPAYIGTPGHPSFEQGRTDAFNGVESQDRGSDNEYWAGWREGRMVQGFSISDFDDDVSSAEESYQAGYWAGKNHRSRSVQKGIDLDYDNGYCDGRAEA